MELILTPESEERLQRRLSEGRWKSPAEVMETALDILDDLDDVIVRNREELEAAIQKGIDSAENERLYTADEVRAHLAEVRAQSQR
jgi:predicted transcriptional regulator